MGRGRSGASGSRGGGGGSQQVVTQVVTQGGQTLDLTNMPLVYGGDDKAVTGTMRKTLEAQEQKRLKSKIEYAVLTDDNGNAIGSEVKGNKGSVNIPWWQMNRAATLTHNHPRGKGEEGCLGGTFSTADLRTFSSQTQMRTMRASAAEGTYSITKGAKFNVGGFQSYYKSVHATHQRAMNKAHSQLMSDVALGRVRYRDVQKKQDAIFNKFLIDMHNDLIAGQSQYGYTYTLERRK